MNILLIGLRASGKTTVGRRLAGLLRLPFVDLDERVLSSFDHPTAAAVWAAHGESAWREAERRALKEALAATGQVIALGGGTPMIAAARTMIERARPRGEAFVVYLRCPAEELARRLAREPGDRPSLTGAPPDEEVAEVLASRDPVYRALADLEVDAAGSSPREAVELIRSRLG